MRTSLSNRPVAFLDRDGTIIEDEHYLSDPNRIRFCREAIEGLTALRDAGFALILITNQSGIARGLFGEADLELVHRRLAELLAEHGLAFDGAYHCPHVDGDGCACRKPLPGMIDQAIADFGIDPARAVMFGDAERDIVAARSRDILAFMVNAPDGCDGSTCLTLLDGALEAIRRLNGA